MTGQPLHSAVSAETGMAEALAREICERLEALAARGMASAIDLTSLPLNAEDRAALEKRLGRGEVEATLDAAGRSEIWETAYPGVWWVRHFGEGDRIATESIEIARIPTILMSQPDDLHAAARRLARDLALPAEPGFAPNGGAGQGAHSPIPDA